MLAFSNDYYGFIFRATQSVELFCAYFEISMILCDVKYKGDLSRGKNVKVKRKEIIN